MRRLAGVLLLIIILAASAVVFAEEDPAPDKAPADYTVGQTASGAASATITAASANILNPQSPFRDTEGHWAEPYIARAVSRGLFSGYDENRFGPDDAVNRGQFVTVLYRQAGSPEVTAEVPFRDISGEIEEFRKAIAWGLENQFVNGTGETRFEPRKKLSRQEAMTILYNCAGKLRGMETLFTATYDKCFTDAGSIAEWAKTPMYWGVYNALVSGSKEGRLKPKESATRAQLAKILLSYSESFGTKNATGAKEEAPGTAIYNLKAEKRIEDKVTLRARTSEGKSIGGKIVVIDGRKITLFPNAGKIEMHYEGDGEGTTYLVTVQKESDKVPTIDSILYMDQAAAEGETVSFMLYPGSLEPGNTYVIYLASDTGEGFTPLQKVASFRSYAEE